MITIQTPINKLGYGYVGYNFVKNLECFAYPIGKVEVDSAEGIQEKVYLSKYNPDSPTVKIYHQHALFDRVGNGKYFGFPIFELDTLIDHEKYSLATPHELIVCSKWAKEILQANGITKPIHIVNLGIDETIFKRDGETPSTPYEQEKKMGGGGRPYIFFNAGKWETRKGHDILIKAFLNAFSIKDNVELWMMTTNPFLTIQEDEEWRRLYTQHNLWSKIKLLPRVSTQAEMAAIMQKVDCGVFPSRAEGWGLEGLEILACGKELITTNYAGHTEYATAENSHLIEFTHLEPAIGKSKTEMGWFNGQGNWGCFTPDAVSQLVEHIKYCYKERPAKNQANYSKFNWSVLAKQLEKLVNG